jgi:type IV pilus assembly protein PilC
MFNWEGINNKKQFCSGKLIARNLIAARLKLKQHGINIKKLQPDSAWLNFISPTKLTKKEVMHFTRQLTTLLVAGFPLTQALATIYNSSKSANLPKITYDLKIRIENGTMLTEALRQHPNSFDDLFCALVDAGEHTGTLEIMLERIARHYESTDLLKKKIRKALTYPCAIVTVAILVSAILLLKVIPTFAALFSSTGHTLPFFTQLVISLSQLSRKYLFIFVVMIVGGVILWMALRRKSSNWRQTTDRLLLKLPLFGLLVRKAILARFCRTLATTFTAGMPLLNCLQLTAKAANNLAYQQAILQISADVSRGETLHHAMAAHPLFPNLLLQLTTIGEESGNLAQMIDRAATIYEEEVDMIISNLSSLLEPAIMTILGILMGGLVIAMYLPIFKIGQVF